MPYKDENSNLVYSTDQGRIQPEKQKAEKAEGFADGYVRVRRETKGRKGKGVIAVMGIPEDSAGLKKIAAILKKKCGTGGTVKDDVIEIQGDKRDIIAQALEKMGYKVKQSGG